MAVIFPKGLISLFRNNPPNISSTYLPVRVNRACTRRETAHRVICGDCRGRRSPSLIDSLGVDGTPFERIVNPKCTCVQSISTLRLPLAGLLVDRNVYSYTFILLRATVALIHSRTLSRRYYRFIPLE